MVEQCIKCGNHKWDKRVESNRIICPQCGHSWSYAKLPLFILTGCSGIGKTTTAHELMRETSDIVVLDADFLYNIMPHETQEDYFQQVDKLLDLSKDIMQAGKPVLWAMAGNLDKVNKVYNRRFFSDVYCLALVCDEKSLLQRMKNGRNIEDEAWIQGSLQYNRYFQTHTSLDDMLFEICDTEGKTVNEVVEEVKKWVTDKLCG